MPRELTAAAAAAKMGAIIHRRSAMRSVTRRTALGFIVSAAAGWQATVRAAQRPAKKPAGKRPKAVQAEISFPPLLPGNQVAVTDATDQFLKPADTLRDGVTVAETPPTIDFAYYPGQTYEGKPWSNWGDSTAVAGKYYSAIGDHLAPAGNAFVFEYDATAKSFRKLLDVKQLLQRPEGHYAPGKIHSRVDLGSDGWLYCSTHRGSPRVTNDQYHYTGDWIVRCHPETAAAEVVAHAPVPKHCIPNGTLDPQRLIFYGGTAPGDRQDDEGVQFFAFDCKSRKLLYAGPDGPSRYMILAQSTGRVYYVPGKGDSPLMRFDPADGKAPVKIDGQIGIRAATRQTPQGIVYTISQGQGAGAVSTVYAFDTRSEKIENLGPAAAGTNQYVAAVTADPTGRYLYYVPGAHGGSERDGSAVIQFDTTTRRRKVIAFLHPFYEQKYGLVPKGTYGLAADPAGERLYITWNVSRGSRAWDCCGVTTIHIPQAERPA
jgi:hypothetical protein